MSIRPFFISVVLMFLVAENTVAQCVAGNCTQGSGVLLYKDGSKYSGQFEQGVPHGWGVMILKKGMKYEGEFVEGQKHGRGEIVFGSGEVYRGDVKLNIIEGKGTMTYKNGDVYRGEWAAGKPSGSGHYFFKDGDAYEGEFIDGKFSGWGKFLTQEGAYYEGGWLKNQKHGWGKLYSQGQTTEVYYEYNQLKERPQEASVSSLRDCNQVYCHDVKGQYKYKDGSVYTGDFAHNKGIGQGECLYANGDKYVGGWKEHAPHGTGKMTFASGRILKAEWVNGHPIRKRVEPKKEETWVKTTSSTAPSPERTKVATGQDTQDKARSPKIYALIVGVASYLHMPSLKYTDDDAYQLYAFLKSPEGGALKDNQIRILIDDAATSLTIRRELKSMIQQPRDNDILLVYMAGHGLDGAFLPSDYDGHENQIPYTEIMEMVNSSSAKHKLLITDACHSGSMLASARSPWTVALDNFYSAYDTARGGTAILTSSKREETSLEYSGLRQGVFSYFLIQGMKGAADANFDKLITLEELQTYVGKEVRAYTQNTQNPRVSGDFDPMMPIGWVRED